MKFDQDLEGLVWNDGMDCHSADCGIVLCESKLNAWASSSSPMKVLQEYTRLSVNGSALTFAKLAGCAYDFAGFKKGILRETRHKDDNGWDIQTITAHFFNGEEKTVYTGPIHRIGYQPFSNGIIIERESTQRPAKRLFRSLKEQRVNSKIREIIAVDIISDKEAILLKEEYPAWVSYGSGIIAYKIAAHFHIDRRPFRIYLRDETELKFINVNGATKKITIPYISRLTNDKFMGSDNGAISVTAHISAKKIVKHSTNGQSKELYSGFFHEWSPCGGGVAVRISNGSTQNIAIINSQGEKIQEFKNLPNLIWRAYG